MNKRVIGIAFSDLHIGEFAKFNTNNQRTLNHFRVLFLIKDICKKYNCPAFFTGDFMHKPEYITSSLEEIMLDQLDKLKPEYDFSIYGISGNHDMVDNNSKERPSPSHWRNLCNRYHFFHNLDFNYHDFGDFRVYGIPYLDHNKGLDDAVRDVIKDSAGKPIILLLHTDYPGARDTDGIEVGTVENLNINLLSKVKLTLIGHIHKPQRLGKKVYMVGAPLQQRRTDRNCKLGYWKIYSDFTAKFVAFNEFPRFIDVESEDQIQDDGNYYTVISKSRPEEETQVQTRITRSMSKRRVVSRYLRNKGIKDKEKKQILVKLINDSSND